MNPLNLVARGLRFIGSLFTPMFVRPSVGSGVVWFLHVLLVVLIAVVLYIVQAKHPPWIDLHRDLGGPSWFKPFWLSVLFLLGYLLLWLAWWTWKLFEPAETVIPFPDIEESWKEIRQALDKSGIGLADTPVFVVLGGGINNGESIFKQIPGGVIVKTNHNSPLTCYANRDTIYLLCTGATLLELQRDPAAIRMSSGAPDMEHSIGMDKSIGMGASQGSGSSIGGGGMMQGIAAIMQRAQREHRALTDAEKQEIRMLSGDASTAAQRPQASAAPARAAAASGGPRRSVLQDPNILEEQTARMAYFVSLLAQSRWPFCPLNGVVVILPADDTEQDVAATQLGLVARQDLANLANAAKMRFPLFLLLANLDHISGADAFLKQFATPDIRQKRLGKSFPLNPDIAPEKAPERIQQVANWVFRNLLHYRVYRLFRVENPESETVLESIERNREMFSLLQGLRKRSGNIARMVARTAIIEEGSIPEFGGVYLTAMQESEGLFLGDFFKQIEKMQAYVAWSDPAYAEDAAYRRKTKAGYTVLAGIAIGVALLGIYALVLHPKT